MKIEIIELEDLSGEKTRVYSVFIDDNRFCLYDQFVEDHSPLFDKELQNFDDRLHAIGHDTGLMADFFKTGLGSRHHHICEFKDRPKEKLRLFFIEEAANNMIILGGGGIKPKNARATQDFKALDELREQLMQAEDILREAEKRGTFRIFEDGSIFSSTNYIYFSEDNDV